MSLPQRFKVSLAVGITALAAAAAHAAPLVIYQTDLNANGQVPPGGNAATARNQFAALMTSTASETFEAAPTGVPGGPLPVLGGRGSLTQETGAGGRVEFRRNDPVTGGFPGRFNTTPGVTGDGRWFQSANDFTLLLNNAESALGLFITDLGDFRGTLSLSLFLGTALLFETIDFQGAAQPNNQGALGFLGVVADFEFDRVLFDITQLPGTAPDEFDVVGFDDFLVGAADLPPPGGVPEPGSLALAGLSLALMSTIGRRRRTA